MCPANGVLKPHVSSESISNNSQLSHYSDILAERRQGGSIDLEIQYKIKYTSGAFKRLWLWVFQHKKTFCYISRWLSYEARVT